MASENQPKRGPGRPPKADDGTGIAGNGMVKLDKELLDKIGWIVRLRKRAEKGYTAAKFIEPLIQGSTSDSYDAIKDEVEAIKKIESKAAQKLKSRDASPGKPH